MVIDLLMNSIENNPELKGLMISNIPIPKVVGYADDITVLLDADSPLQPIFDEYQKFTLATGLRLNADKTEVMYVPENKNKNEQIIKYINDDHTIKSQEMIKLNGIKFSSDANQTNMINWDEILSRIKRQLELWVPRGLCLLGKIQVIKTFAISQALYICRVLPPDEKIHKRVKKLLDHFLWGKSFVANKGPNRIKAEIFNSTLAQRGFGMINFKDLVDAMCIRQVAISCKMNDTLRLITDICCSFNYSIAPKNYYYLDPIMERAVDNIAKLHEKAAHSALSNDDKIHLAFLKQKLKNSPKRDVIRPQALNGVWGHLHPSRFLTPISENSKKKVLITPWDKIIDTKDHGIVQRDLTMLPMSKGTIKELCSVKGNELRALLTTTEVVQVTKSSLIMTQGEALTFWARIKKIQNVKIKNDLLRLLHGDVFYNDKLFRQGRRESANCDWCQELEDLEHKIFECPRVSKLWSIMVKESGLTQGADFAETIMLNANNPKHLAYITKVIHLYLYNPSIAPDHLPRTVKKYLQDVGYYN